jgi:ankyrin repeat protein
LEQYWSEVTGITNTVNLQMFANNLLKLCSQNFSDEDVEFTGIPLQTMMLGEAFIREVKLYCCSGGFNLTESINLLSLFNKFTENKFDIYFREKCQMDPSKPGVKRYKKNYIEKHMISALLYLLSPKEFCTIRGAINSSKLKETNRFLREGEALDFGMIKDFMDEKPHFIHRSFAEYYAAKWLTDNFRGHEKFIANILFNSTNEVTRNIFDRMIAEDSEIHGSVLNNDIHAFKEILNKQIDINILDKGGRTALHLTASYNRPYLQQLLSFPGTDAHKVDAILKWTPLRYADRTKSWMAIDILLQNGANPDDIVFTRCNAKSREWGQAAVWECASKGYIKLLEFMMNCGISVNARVDVPENLHKQYTLLHRASYCGQFEVVRLFVKRGADLKIRDTCNINTALHMAAIPGSVDIIQLLLDEGINVNLSNTDDATALHFSAEYGHLEATKVLVERGAAINYTNKYGHTPLMVAAYYGKLEIVRYLTEIGADINIPSANNVTALHTAAGSGSVDIIKLLLDKGMNVNLTTTDDSSPLYISAQFGHLEATKVLVERGAAINSTYKDGSTPLMVAAYSGKLEIVRYLTEIGADINISDASNNSPLHIAAEMGSVDIIKLLLNKGMPVNLTNTDDATALHFSAECGHLGATKVLVERGAAINYPNKYGSTPVMLAGYNDNLEVFRYLTDILRKGHPITGHQCNGLEG